MPVDSGSRSRSRSKVVGDPTSSAAATGKLLGGAVLEGRKKKKFGQSDNGSSRLRVLTASTAGSFEVLKLKFDHRAFFAVCLPISLPIA